MQGVKLLQGGEIHRFQGGKGIRKSLRCRVHAFLIRHHVHHLEPSIRISIVSLPEAGRVGLPVKGRRLGNRLGKGAAIGLRLFHAVPLIQHHIVNIRSGNIAVHAQADFIVALCGKQKDNFPPCGLCRTIGGGFLSKLDVPLPGIAVVMLGLHRHPGSLLTRAVYPCFTDVLRVGGNRYVPDLGICRGGSGLHDFQAGRAGVLLLRAVGYRALPASPVSRSSLFKAGVIISG